MTIVHSTPHQLVPIDPHARSDLPKSIGANENEDENEDEDENCRAEIS